MKNESRPSFWGFTTQLFLIIVLPLTVLVLVVAFGSQSLHQDAMRSMVGDRDLKAVRAAASSLEQEIMHRAATIQILGRELGPRADFSTLSLNTGEIQAVFEGGIALFGPDQGLLQATNPALWQGTPPGLAGFIEQASGASPGVQFSAPITLASQVYVLVGTAAGGGKFLLGAFLPGAVVQETIANIAGSGQISALVISRVAGGAGFEILFRSGALHSDAELGTHPGLKESLNGESGINYFQSSAGEHVVAFSPIPMVGWGLVIEEAWEDIAGPALSSTQAAPLVLVPVLLLALVALAFGARRIVRPLQALEKQAARLAEGDFDAIRAPVGGIGEIRSLQEKLVEMSARLQAAQESLHGYIGAITAGVENERRSLARELHDETIQSLIALNQRIQLAGRTPTAAQKEALPELQVLVQQTIASLRRLIRGLRPIYLEELGLSTALEMLAKESERAAGIPVAFQRTGSERRLDPQTEMSLYRMAQEALSNVTRHAQASQAWLRVEYGADFLAIEIGDNGKGFSLPARPAEFARQGHFGLLGLQERAELIGAALEIVTAPGQGTRVLIRLNK